MNWVTPGMKRSVRGVAAAFAALTLVGVSASAAEPREELRASFDKALKGKKVARPPMR